MINHVREEGILLESSFGVMLGSICDLRGEEKIKEKRRKGKKECNEIQDQEKEKQS
jgi:hypothetical protein